MERSLKIFFSILLLLRLADLSYGYYQFVHFVSCIAFAYFAYLEREKSTKWVIFYITMVILFQPFIKISLSRELWSVVCVIVVFILLISLIKPNRNRKTNENKLDKNDSKLNDSRLSNKNLNSIDFYIPKYDKYVREKNLKNQQKVVSENLETLKFNEIYVFGIRTLFDVYDFEFIKSNFSLDEINFGLNKNLYLIQIIDDRIDLIAGSVQRFIDFAISCNDRKFSVVSIPIDDNKIIPLFAKAFNISNIYLPKKYVDFLSNSIDPLILNDIYVENIKNEFSCIKYDFINNFQYLKKYFPGYLRFVYRLDYEYNLDIISEFDGLIKQSIINSLNFNDHLNTLTKMNKFMNNNVLLNDFLVFINCICSQCGSNENIKSLNNILVLRINYEHINLCYNCYSKLNSEEYYLNRSTNLWFTFNKNLTYLKASNFVDFYEKEIRFISNTGEIDIAKFGYYFYCKGELYIISDNPKYTEFDIKNTIHHEILIDKCYDNYFIFKSNYAGHYTGFKDITSNKIYTGDIVKVQINSLLIIGVVVSGTYKGYNPDFEFELYEIVSNFNFTNNFWYAFLKDALQVEVYSNIFSILEKFDNINIIEVAEISGKLNKDFSHKTFTLDGFNVIDSDKLKFL